MDDKGQIDNGGPAFPVDCYFVDGKPDEGRQTGENSGMAMGLTLRDYFAAKAMAADISTNEIGLDNYNDFRMLAQEAYQCADAMIKIRANK